MCIRYRLVPVHSRRSSRRRSRSRRIRTDLLPIPVPIHAPVYKRRFQPLPVCLDVLCVKGLAGVPELVFLLCVLRDILLQVLCGKHIAHLQPGPAGLDPLEALVPAGKCSFAAGHQKTGQETAQGVIEQIRPHVLIRLFVGLLVGHSGGHVLLCPAGPVVVVPIPAPLGNGGVGDPVCNGGEGFLGGLYTGLCEEHLHRILPVFGRTGLHKMIQREFFKCCLRNTGTNRVENGRAVIPAELPHFDVVLVCRGAGLQIQTDHLDHGCSARVSGGHCDLCCSLGLAGHNHGAVKLRQISQALPAYDRYAFRELARQIAGVEGAVLLPAGGHRGNHSVGLLGQLLSGLCEGHRAAQQLHVGSQDVLADPLQPVLLRLGLLRIVGIFVLLLAGLGEFLGLLRVLRIKKIESFLLFVSHAPTHFILF